MTSTNSAVRLTQYSHGAGCGCKISPKILNTILEQCKTEFPDANLLVGNSTLDDAAVYDIGNNQVVISTTDFFMPIVDDPFDFGGIAAVNAGGQTIHSAFLNKQNSYNQNSFPESNSSSGSGDAA